MKVNELKNQMVETSSHSQHRFTLESMSEKELTKIG